VELRATVPVLRVRDVRRSAAWYCGVLGFVAEPFPPQPPHEFAMLSRDQIQVMLRRDPRADDTTERAAGWDLFIRVTGGEISTLFAGMPPTDVVRVLERMPYGDLEFELRDPDGLVICLGEHVMLGRADGVGIA
jgi:catechol 2,3-dioxygenase-like lactoylglutathione lyase family enzyme